MRKPFIAGNWKMNKTVSEGAELAKALISLVEDVNDVEIVVCPPAVDLYLVKMVLEGTNIGLGAQNMHWEDSGAFTGEISPVMLKELCQYVIIGHSERRQYFAETDETVNKKVKAAFAHELIPIICVGESLEERESGQTEKVCERQVLAALDGLTEEQVARAIIAYEPIWAIGTGRSATSSDANETIGFIRNVVRNKFGDSADKMRILYGGSVKPNNISEYMKEPEIDGALVGGASLDAESFAAIVKFE
ncbi:triose-phosphate isomerase [Anoxybacter fermentans]|uniref:Triosephosphate isomerase n=1 Tax=Anoxybacter fermentans TaxID=1323375 RepID=A0A3Q9HNY1_9FIRM|nr:triose-phosphate isomerase [Anoxybacter fermentans]AZR72279.1 triose-phosphate isomerase [Anoxybacter fermentans]